MKKFLIKTFIYVLLCLINIFFWLNYKGCLNSNKDLLFISNSISFNAKAKFLINHKNQLLNANYLIIGSSMSLNNIDGNKFENQIKSTTINLSSWGLKLIDMDQFKQFYTPKTKVIINISFSDFGESDIKHYFGFPLNDEFEIINKFFNLPTYNSQIIEIKSFKSKNYFSKYQNLNFDKTGGAMLIKDSFNISAKRWDDSPKIPSDQDLKRFIDDLNLFQNNEVYIFFSPERNKYKNSKKSNSILKLKQRIEQKYKNISFLNNYGLDYNDSLFVDCIHFNNFGAKNYTQLMLKQINAITKSSKNGQVSPN